MTVGDPMADDTDMGPLNNEAVAVKMDHHVENAREHGAAIAAGGERLPEVGSSLYYEPTVIDGVTEEMVVSSEETFGPIAPVTTFSSYEEALSTANEDAYGLTSAVFTSNVKSMRYFAEGIEAGTVIVNDGSGYWENQLPMGGYSGKDSGYGRRGGKHTIEEMSQLKTIVTDFENVRNDHL
jgi:succinate-semialdehyde dehydrogenase/glutarate-semialdehyde dehydrogenase